MLNEGKYTSPMDPMRYEKNMTPLGSSFPFQDLMASKLNHLNQKDLYKRTIMHTANIIYHQAHISTIHVRYIRLHLVDFYGDM